MKKFEREEFDVKWVHILTKVLQIIGVLLTICFMFLGFFVVILIVLLFIKPDFF